MSKYDPLRAAIAARKEDAVRLTFAEIERILAFPIDHSFLSCKKELPACGWRFVKLSRKEEWVDFIRL